jgi:sulfide:quinone oxidoreductase
MKPRILVLGAGFGGLELTSILSDALGENIDLTLIDKADAFIFGYSKLDVMFGHEPPEAVRVPYRHIAKPGVKFHQETITGIDPQARRVTTDRAGYETDVLVVALGADYDVAATPGLAEAGNEYYSVAGAETLREVLPTFSSGRAIVGVCSTPFKCPPAPSEAALLLHDHLKDRGVRADCEISLVMPFGAPIPPSPDTSQALLQAFRERNIRWVPNRLVRALDPERRVAVLDDGAEMPYELFLGIPKHRVPDVVAASGMTAEDGWVPVNPLTLETRFPGVYAVGDVTSVGTPKAGVFSEGAARVVAAEIMAAIEKGEQPAGYDGRGFCYIEFGAGRVGSVEVQFLSGQPPTGWFHGASEALAAEKRDFGATRRARWFGIKESNL